MRWDLGPIEQSSYQESLDDVWELVEREPTRLLDMIEWFLEQRKGDSLMLVKPLDAAELDEVLTQGNSIYRVRDDCTGLELRVVPEVRQQVQAVVDAAAGSPGVHLATAWNEAYGRNTDPVKAYSEAIKAIEAAAAPVVSPSNGKATLGTIIRDIGAKPAKWQLAIRPNDEGGVDEVRRMMKLLWEGQTSRHGGITPTQPETAEAARAAVLLAAVLVQFCVSGVFALASSV